VVPGAFANLEVLLAHVVVAQRDTRIERLQIDGDRPVDMRAVGGQRSRERRGLRIEAAADRHRAHHAHGALRDVPLAGCNETGAGQQTTTNYQTPTTRTPAATPRALGVGSWSLVVDHG